MQKLQRAKPWQECSFVKTPWRTNKPGAASRVGSQRVPGRRGAQPAVSRAPLTWVAWASTPGCISTVTDVLSIQRCPCRHTLFRNFQRGPVPSEPCSFQRQQGLSLCKRRLKKKIQVQSKIERKVQRFLIYPLTLHSHSPPS